MKYKILRLIESKNTMKESTNSDIKRMRQDLYARERQALKDLGDPNWEDLVGLKDRLPEEQFDAFMKEEGKIRAIEMIHSILTYTDPEYWTTDYVMSNKYMKKYIEELGEDVVSDIVNQEIEEYKNNAIIDKDTYTDSEGVTYNSVRFKNESAMTEDIDTGKDLENDTVNQVVDDMQDETTAEEEEESNSLDSQLADLREVLPDLDLNLYQVIDKEDTNKVFYFIGKVAEDSDDLLMLIDNNPSNDIDEPSNIDNKLPEDEDADEEINDLEDDTEIQNQPLEDESNEERFDFIKVPLKYEDFITLNPRYGNDINPDHEAIMEYLMKCLVEENPERAEELSDDNLVSEEDNTKVPLDDKIQSQIDDKIEFYANN